jgi:hypothetical protein
LTLNAEVVADKPAVLMLSHCVPQPAGSGARVEAWRLLTAAAARHRVYLACLRDGPVNLAQWRLVCRHAQRIALESPPVLARAFRRFGAEPGVASSRQSLLPVARLWLNELPFTAAICTNTALEPLVAKHLPIWGTPPRVTSAIPDALYLPELEARIEIAKAA